MCVWKDIVYSTRVLKSDSIDYYAMKCGHKMSRRHVFAPRCFWNVQLKKHYFQSMDYSLLGFRLNPLDIYHFNIGLLSNKVPNRESQMYVFRSCTREYFTVKSRHTHKILIICINKVNLSFVSYQIFVRRLCSCVYVCSSTKCFCCDAKLEYVVHGEGDGRMAKRRSQMNKSSFNHIHTVKREPQRLYAPCFSIHLGMQTATMFIEIKRWKTTTSKRTKPNECKKKKQQSTCLKNE